MAISNRTGSSHGAAVLRIILDINAKPPRQRALSSPLPLLPLPPPPARPRTPAPHVQVSLLNTTCETSPSYPAPPPPHTQSVHRYTHPRPSRADRRVTAVTHQSPSRDTATVSLGGRGRRTDGKKASQSSVMADTHTHTHTSKSKAISAGRLKGQTYVPTCLPALGIYIPLAASRVIFPRQPSPVGPGSDGPINATCQR